MRSSCLPWFLTPGLFFGEQFSPFSSLWFPKISVVYSCSFKEYQYISEKSRTHSRRYRGWNPWFYGNVSIMVIKAWMSNYNCLTMMILRKCRANYEELTSLINTGFLFPTSKGSVTTTKRAGAPARSVRSIHPLMRITSSRSSETTDAAGEKSSAPSESSSFHWSPWSVPVFRIILHSSCRYIGRPTNFFSIPHNLTRQDPSCLLQ